MHLELSCRAAQVGLDGLRAQRQPPRDLGVAAAERDLGQHVQLPRDLLLAHREDCDATCQEFAWPDLPEFNWALDWFDALAADPAQADRPALRIAEEDGAEEDGAEEDGAEEDGADITVTFRQLARRSDQVANWLRDRGAGCGDRIVVMLGNQVELWESMLAAIKLGVVVIPSSTLLAPADLADRVARGHARHVIARAGRATAPQGGGGRRRERLRGPDEGGQALLARPDQRGVLRGRRAVPA